MIVDALAREVGEVGKLLHKLRAGDWEKPTRCAPMTVKDLTAHMLRGASRIVEILGNDPVDDQPEKDGVTYWQVELVAEAPAIAARAQQDASAFASPKDLLVAWDEGWIKALRAVRAADADAVRPTTFGLMTMSEYLRTRCIEVVIHHMDLDDALGKDIHPDPAALTVVGDVLRGLLGTDLRPVGIDDERFALTATGRATLTDEEKTYLGPLANRFPLLS